MKKSLLLLFKLWSYISLGSWENNHGMQLLRRQTKLRLLEKSAWALIQRCFSYNVNKLNRRNLNLHCACSNTFWNERMVLDCQRHCTFWQIPKNLWLKCVAMPLRRNIRSGTKLQSYIRIPLWRCIPQNSVRYNDIFRYIRALNSFIGIPYQPQQTRCFERINRQGKFHSSLHRTLGTMLQYKSWKILENKGTRVAVHN